METRHSRVIGLGFEPLESRIPLAGDIAIINAYLVDLDAQPITSVVEGQRAIVRVNYSTTNLSASDQFVIRFELDGGPVESAIITGQPGSNQLYYRYRVVGYAAPGPRSVRVFLDGNNQVSETNESNNEFSFQFTPVKPQLNQKFIMPLVEDPAVEWTILNLHDVDLRTGISRDFSGGFLQYDNHEAWDLFVPNFASMDEGVPVVAAADGVVVQVNDGSFDRENFWDFTLPDPRISNTVVIQHADGWTTGYYHLMRDSVAVKVGQSVAAGQVLGLIASSGISDGPHVHFSIAHNSIPVEPMFALDDYFVEPPTYLGDRIPKVTASLIANRDPVPDYKEMPNDVRSFQLNGTTQPWLWYRLEYIRQGQVLTTRWYRPDGSLFREGNWNAPANVRYLQFWSTSQGVDAVGDWTVVSSIDGVEILRESYNVVAGNGVPEIDLRQEDTYILDARSTPIDFGIAGNGNSQPSRIFTISNFGTAPLTLSNFELPTGFDFVGSIPQLIAPGSSVDFTIAMNTDVVDHFFGDVRFTTNDLDEGEFSFPVEGRVSGQPPAQAPIVSHAKHALSIQNQVAVQPVFPEPDIVSATGQNWDQTRLVAEIAAGKDDTGKDRLILRPTDNSLHLESDAVSYDGTMVATLTQSGVGGRLELVFNANATLQAVKATAAAISFWEQQTDPSSRKRVVSLQFLRPDGMNSNTIYRAAYYANGSFEHPPSINTIADQTIDEDASLQALPLNIGDLNQTPESLAVQVQSSHPNLVSDSQLSAYFSNGSWFLNAVPQPDASGVALIRLQVSDASGNISESSFSLYVQSINDVPQISSVNNQTLEQDSSTNPITFQIGDVETPVDVLQVTASSSNQQLLPSSGIILSGSGATRSIVLTPTLGAIGQSVINISVMDAEGAKAATTFTLTVTAETVPPSISSIQTQEMLEDQDLDVSFTISDNKTTASQLQITVSSNNATLFPPSSFQILGSGTDRVLRLSPTANRFGESSISLTVSDSAGNSANRSFLTRVLAVNDVPSFSIPETASSLEDSAMQSTPITNISSGPSENQLLAFNVISDNPQLFSNIEVKHVLGQSSATFDWQPAPNAFGSAMVQIILRDAGLDNNFTTTEDNLQFSRFINIVIVEQNDPPTFDGPTNLFADEDALEQQTRFENVSAGYNEQQPISVSVSPVAENFFLTLESQYHAESATIDLFWQPLPNAYGSTEVILQVTDGGLDQDLLTLADNLTTTETLTITIASENDAPSFSISSPRRSLRMPNCRRPLLTPYRQGPENPMHSCGNSFGHLNQHWNRST